MKRRKKKHNINPVLLEKFCELAFGFVIIAIALGIALLTDIPFEAVCLFTFLIFICIFGLVLVIFHIKKKEKLKIYLANRTEPYSLFERTLQDYIKGSLKVSLECLGFISIQIHVDLTDSHKCIDIQGRYKSYYLNAQLTETQLAIGYSDIEPDPETFYPVDMETPDGFLLTKIREHMAVSNKEPT